MNAWSHGAAGIGLSRLRAYELLGKPEYKEDALAALERSKLSVQQRPFELPTFTLCHGIRGVADLFLEAYRYWNNPEHLALARGVAERMLQMRITEGLYRSGYPSGLHRKDASLFMGNAGIGHFYLRVLDPLHTTSILLPRVEETPEPTNSDRGRSLIDISMTTVRGRTLKRVYSRTLESLQTFSPEVMSHFVQANPQAAQTSELDRFSEFVDGVIQTLSPLERNRVEKVFLVEREKIAMDREIASNALVRISESIKIERASKLLELGVEEFTNLVLELDKSSKLIEMQLEVASESLRETLAAEDEGWSDKEDLQVVLLRVSPGGIIEIPLTALSYRILKTFSNEKTIGDAIDALMREIEFERTDKSSELRLVLTSQIKEALGAGILVSKDLPELEFNKPEVPSL